MTGYAYRRADTIHGLFGWCVQRWPDSTAIVHSGRKVGYRELDELSDSYAAALQERGVHPGHLVPVLLPRTVEMVASLLAVLKCGAGYAALDPRWPPERLRALIAGVDGPVLVTDRPGWTGWAPGGPDGRKPQPVAVQGSDPAVVFFTSGSTGVPKGVVLPHTGTARLFDGYDTDPFEPFGPDVVQAQTMPMHWDGSILDLWSALLCGGTSVFVDDVLEPALLRRVIRAEGVNAAGFLPGALFNVFVDEDVDAFTGLRFLGIGGERLSPAHVERFLTRHPDVALTNIYGPVESTALVTAHRISLADPANPAGIPLGSPVPATSVHVLAGTRRCDVGEVGELCLAGDGLALRYLNNPELTAEKFVEVEGVRVYRTGDLGLLAEDGLYYYAGRNDRQVKISGHRIEPGEVERTADRVPGVARSAVVTLYAPDGTAQALKLCYVGTTTPDEVRAALSGKLPGYLVPRHIEQLPTLPLTGNGKIDRAALTALSTMEPSAPASGDPVTEAFRQILGVPSVGPEDSFLALGGSSLDAARLCARIGVALRIPVPVSQIYRTPTVAALCAWLESAGAAEVDPPAAGGAVPLTVGQANYLTATTRTICVLTWWVDGPVDTGALRAALTDVHLRHQSLHAHYVAGDPPLARLPADPWAPELRLLPADADRTAALAAVNAAVQEPLEFTAGQVWRAVLADAGPDHPALFGIGVHHIAFDGWSEQILARDLSFAYAARLSGVAPQWTEPAPGLTDLARAAGRPGPAELARQRRYWQRQLRDLPGTTLPGLPGGPVPATGPTGGRRFVVSADELARWDGYARERRATRFGYLLAIFAAVLRELTGRADLGVLVPVAMRGNLVCDAAITCRVNPVVLRLRPPAPDTDLFAHTAAALNGALAAHDLPFGQIIAAVAQVRPDLDALLNLPIFVFQDVAADRLTLPGCRVEAVEDRQAQDIPSPLAIDFALTDTGANLHVGVRTDLAPLSLADTVGERYLAVLRAGPHAFTEGAQRVPAALHQESRSPSMLGA
jgi:amino acid adenylation domain-containing protein